MSTVATHTHESGLADINMLTCDLGVVSFLDHVTETYSRNRFICFMIKRGTITNFDAMREQVCCSPRLPSENVKITESNKAPGILVRQRDDHFVYFKTFDYYAY